MPIHILPNLPHAGELVVWGDTSKGLSTVPPGNDFNQVAMGGGPNSLAIRVSGFLELWGDSAFKPLPKWNSPGVHEVKYWGPSDDAVIGLTHFLAILPNHSVVPWGGFLNGNPVTPPVGLRAKAVALTANFDVAIDMSDHLIQWPATARPLPPAGTFTKISGRGDYVIAQRTDGRLYGWQIATVTPGVTPPPPYFASWPGWIKDGPHYYTPGNFIDLAAGVVWKDPKKLIPNMTHISALRGNGSVAGWGTNLYGETTEKSGPFVEIAAGLSYTLGLDSGGHISQWGAAGGGINAKGEAYKGTDSVPSGRFISMGAGSTHATAVRVSLVHADPGPDVIPNSWSPTTVGTAG